MQSPLSRDRSGQDNASIPALKRNVRCPRNETSALKIILLLPARSILASFIRQRDVSVTSTEIAWETAPIPGEMK